MKYNNDTLTSAIYFLMPDFKKARDKGVNMNNTRMLTSIAEDQFIKPLEIGHNPSYDERIAIYVCQEAMRDLHKLGQFDFGVMDYDFGKGEEL